MSETLDEAARELDAVYRERNALVVAFAALASTLGHQVANIPAPDAPGYRIVYVDLPSGQVSWHIPDAESRALDGFGAGIEWDGHDTPTKYQRLASFAAQPASLPRRRPYLPWQKA